ncbi:MAG: acyltransferase [Planctomycetota bacterium]
MKKDFEASVKIHPTATVDDSCSIGEGTRIWHYSHISTGVQIGRNCNFGQNVYIAPHVQIGPGVKIQNNVSIYEGVELEADVFCGPSVVFTNVKHPRSAVSRKNEYLRTLVKRGATLGANATILCGITVGEFAFIGAGAVVTKEVPAYALVTGNPARRVGWCCECGETLKFQKEKAVCSRCQQIYIQNPQGGIDKK